MASSIIVERCFDESIVFAAVLHCFDTIVEDGTDPSCINFNVDHECWLLFKRDDDVLGLMQMTPYNRTTIDIHPYIYKDKRKYSLECGKLAIEWFNENAPQMYKKLITQVPSCYRHIKQYALKLGFELEGTYKNSYAKNGELKDLWLFGKERVQ